MHGCVTAFIRSVQTANEREQAMHAALILQCFLQQECSFMHAKRQQCVARIAHAACTQGLGVVKLAKGLGRPEQLRHAIKCCDRLLSNPRFQQESIPIYRALARQILGKVDGAAIIVDWSELRADGSLQLLRAAVMAKGRALTIYEEVHPQDKLGSPIVQRLFMRRLKTILPAALRVIIVTDAGFRATWFRMLDQQKWAWIGRIRNRDMVRADGTPDWVGCKTWYTKAHLQPRHLGNFSYARANPVPCSLTLHRRPPKHRHHKTKLGQPCRSTHSQKARAAQMEPWLLAVSPRLNSLSAEEVIRVYTGRMQIEQTFRDLKSPRTALGLSTCQTRGAARMAMLLLIGALASYALWIIGLAMQKNGASIRYGSAKKSATTLSIVGLAMFWLNHCTHLDITPSQLDLALDELRSLIANFKI
jgi:hypothetical protein